jgi:hypothetical protein
VIERLPLGENVNAVAQAARDYLALGLQPIPIPLRSKNPGRDDWQDERCTVEDVPQKFSSHKNIGLLLGEASNGLVDLDLDCPEAVALAPAFLPFTGFKSGHATNPVSHYWYVSPPGEWFRQLDLAPFDHLIWPHPWVIDDRWPRL